MSGTKDKLEAMLYIADWLLEERGENQEGRLVRNLDLISDPGLLDELIHFNMDGNFDRVMGFAGCIIGLEETFNQYKDNILTEAAEKKPKPEFPHK
jgi:hypothetical protein